MIGRHDELVDAIVAADFRNHLEDFVDGFATRLCRLVLRLTFVASRVNEIVVDVQHGGGTLEGTTFRLGHRHEILVGNRIALGIRLGQQSLAGLNALGRLPVGQHPFGRTARIRTGHIKSAMRQKRGHAKLRIARQCTQHRFDLRGIPMCRLDTLRQLGGNLVPKAIRHDHAHAHPGHRNAILPEVELRFDTLDLPFRKGIDMVLEIPGLRIQIIVDVESIDLVFKRSEHIDRVRVGLLSRKIVLNEQTVLLVDDKPRLGILGDRICGIDRCQVSRRQRGKETCCGLKCLIRVLKLLEAATILAQADELGDIIDPSRPPLDLRQEGIQDLLVNLAIDVERTKSGIVHRFELRSDMNLLRLGIGKSQEVLLELGTVLPVVEERQRHMVEHRTLMKNRNRKRIVEKLIGEIDHGRRGGLVAIIHRNDTPEVLLQTELGDLVELVRLVLRQLPQESRKHIVDTGMIFHLAQHGHQHQDEIIDRQRVRPTDGIRQHTHVALARLGLEERRIDGLDESPRPVVVTESHLADRHRDRIRTEGSPGQVQIVEPVAPRIRPRLRRIDQELPVRLLREDPVLDAELISADDQLLDAFNLGLVEFGAALPALVIPEDDPLFRKTALQRLIHCSIHVSAFPLTTSINFTKTITQTSALRDHLSLLISRSASGPFRHSLSHHFYA